MARFQYLVVSTLIAVSLAVEFEMEPVNVAGRTGEELPLNCTVDLTLAQTLQWKVTPVGGTEDGIYLAYPKDEVTVGAIVPGYTGNYEAVDDKPHDITIKSMSHELAGLYKCEVTTYPIGGTEIKPLQAMGMGEMGCPEEKMRQAGETPTFDCSVQVSGLIDPELSWKVGEQVLQGELVMSDEEDAPVAPELRTITYRYNFTVSADDDGKVYTCELRFKDGYEENNVPPSYTDSCSTSVQVVYGVTAIEFDPSPDDFDEDEFVVEIGKLLNCTGNGNPEPRYYWKKNEGPGDLEELHESSLEIKKDMKGRNHFTCTAENMISGQPSTKQREVIFEAICNYDDPDSPCNSACGLFRLSIPQLLLLSFIIIASLRK